MKNKQDKTLSGISTKKILTKEEETLEIWEYHIQGILELEDHDYDFSKIEPYIDVFNEIPSESKPDIIMQFVLLLHFYLLENVQRDVPMHNKVITKDLYNKMRKNSKIAKDFLEMITNDYAPNNFGSGKTFNELKTQVQLIIDEHNELLNMKAVTKIQMKEYLMRINNEFCLKKSLQVKQLVDNI